MAAARRRADGVGSVVDPPLTDYSARLGPPDISIDDESSSETTVENDDVDPDGVLWSTRHRAALLALPVVSSALGSAAASSSTSSTARWRGASSGTEAAGAATDASPPLLPSPPTHSPPTHRRRRPVPSTGGPTPAPLALATGASQINDLMSASVTPAWRAKGALARGEFSRYCAQHGLSWEAASTEHCRQWIVSLFHARRGDLASGHLAMPTIVAKASALDFARRAAQLPLFGPEPRTRTLLQALRRLRPSGRLAPSQPRAPHLLVAHLPTDDSFNSVRLRALFGVRTVTLMRPSAPLAINFDSVAEATAPNGRQVVVFTMRSSKGAKIAAVVADSNHVEFLPAASPVLFACPARNLLRLCDMIRTRATALACALPDTPFCEERTLAPLGADRVSNLVTALMVAAGWRDCKSRELRMCANSTLASLGVDVESICVRGGWASATNATRVDNYSNHRFVHANFARLLLEQPSDPDIVA
jgi:putative hemolysin